MHLNEKEKKELILFARSTSLREDLRQVTSLRAEWLQNQNLENIETWLTFLKGYNEFINHKPKPFRPISEKIMKI